jgi:3-oxoacyl-[acyl-carrier protein] reductase
MNPQELTGSVAIVTGAGRNIGRAIALKLAAAGAAVVVNGRSSREETQAVVREIAAQGGRALPFLADVTDGQAVDRMVTAATQRFGCVNILVNNAALRVEIPFRDMTPVTGVMSWLSSWTAPLIAPKPLSHTFAPVASAPSSISAA